MESKIDINNITKTYRYIKTFKVPVRNIVDDVHNVSYRVYNNTCTNYFNNLIINYINSMNNDDSTEINTSGFVSLDYVMYKLNTINIVASLLHYKYNPDKSVNIDCNILIIIEDRSDRYKSNEEFNKSSLQVSNTWSEDIKFVDIYFNPDNHVKRIINITKVDFLMGFDLMSPDNAQYEIIFEANESDRPKTTMDMMPKDSIYNSITREAFNKGIIIKNASYNIENDSISLEINNDEKISIPLENNKKRDNYISWDEFFMGVATLASFRSKDPNTQVGACIVKDNKIISTGYNGFPIGISDDSHPWNKTDSSDSPNDKRFWVVHAELNAILNASQRIDSNCTIYTTLFPCHECAKAIIQSGIKKIIYKMDESKSHKEEIDATLDMLKEAGVVIEKIDSTRLFVSYTFIPQLSS